MLCLVEGRAYGLCTDSSHHFIRIGAGSVGDSFRIVQLNFGLTSSSVLNNKIFIGQWIRDLCESEDELAAIVAHEKAHLVLKHGEKAWYEKVCECFTGWFTDESKPRFRWPPDPKSMARENVTELLVV